MPTSRARDSIQRTKMIDMKDMSGKILWTKGREAGIEAERERISKMAEARICFDFHNSGVCDHSVCYGMAELIITIREAKVD
jgi:hypothetical protein